MATRSKRGETRFVVELPPELGRDLAVFLKAHFDASRATVVRTAIRRLINQELEDDGFRKKFHETMAEEEKRQPAKLKLVGSKERPGGNSDE